jgi:hypothetical protein
MDSVPLWSSTWSSQRRLSGTRARTTGESLWLRIRVSQPPDIPYRPPTWPEVRRLADQVLAATNALVVLSPDPSGVALQLAYAASARSRRLLMGVLALVEAELEDTCGVLIRSLYETWLVGMFALLGGQEELDRLFLQQEEHLRPIGRVLGHESEEPGMKLPVEQIAQRVTKLMKKRRMPNPRFALEGYKVLYSYESYRSTHGGLGSIEGHIERYPDRVEVVLRRPEDDDLIRHRVLTALAIFLSGAQMVAIESGQDRSELDLVADQIMAFGSADDQPS